MTKRDDREDDEPEFGPIALDPERVEEIRRDFSSYVESRRPPAPLIAAKTEVLTRVHRDARRRNVGEESGSYALDVLLSEAVKSVETVAAERLAEKQEQLKEAKQELARVREAYETELREEKSKREVRAAAVTVEKRKTRKRREGWLLKTIGVILLMVASAMTARYIGPSHTATETHE